MTKKQNTILFITVGTLVEVFLSILFIVILFIAAAFLTKGNPDTLRIVTPICLTAGFVCAVFAYHRLAAWAIIKFKLEDKLDPLIPQKFRKKNKD